MMTMSFLSPLPSAPPTWCWRFQWVGRRAGVLALSLAFGTLAYAAPGVAHPHVISDRVPQDESCSKLSRPAFLDCVQRRVGPAMVRIDSVHVEPIGGRPSPAPNRLDSDPLFSDGFFEEFFQSRASPKKLGYGVVFTEEGLILTTAQVVEKADYHLDLHLFGGPTLPGKLAGVDFVADLAVVKVVAPPPFPMAPFGDSGALAVEDWVTAMGKGWLSTGRVSNLTHHRGAAEKQVALIQTSGVANTGAGTPLVNAAGEVVGINTPARRGRPKDEQWFAVPINRARAVAEEVVEEGLSHPTLGASLWSLTPALAREFNQNPDNTGFQLPERYGVLILHVRPRSPAAQAGLQAGDVVLTAAGKGITSPGALFRLVESTGARGRLQLSVWRQKREQQVTVVPEEMAEQVRRAMQDTVTPLPSPSLP